MICYIHPLDLYGEIKWLKTNSVILLKLLPIFPQTPIPISFMNHVNEPNINFVSIQCLQLPFPFVNNILLSLIWIDFHYHKFLAKIRFKVIACNSPFYAAPEKSDVKKPSTLFLQLSIHNIMENFIDIYIKPISNGWMNGWLAGWLSVWRPACLPAFPSNIDMCRLL